MAQLRRRLFGEMSWLQVLAGALAAMIAAWAASRLGVAGTIIGAALGSLVATVSSAFFARTLETGRTLLVQTERGTVIEKHLEEGESVTEAFEEVADVAAQPRGARVVDDRSGVHWPTVLVTSVVVLVIAIGTITVYELVVGKEWGTNDKGTTIGKTFGGGGSSKDDDEPDPTPTPTVPTTTLTTPIPTDVTPSPSPTLSTTPPTPFPTDPGKTSPTPE
ncbi:hypothetical protein [Aeromicrobium terrae]|uniref:Uncharacterized protein n=1 Tax=Aeromicrobium terrae TaxID=2498846 RepID=A0A5C8NN91_9ACTN|nr:hypothetical protein [Aeromicrobium terrae]TXL63219.1 hypothetical protein FHP06_03055 [Aeromicrobium terrae]